MLCMKFQGLVPLPLVKKCMGVLIFDLGGSSLGYVWLKPRNFSTKRYGFPEKYDIMYLHIEE